MEPKPSGSAEEDAAAAAEDAEEEAGAEASMPGSCRACARRETGSEGTSLRTPSNDMANSLEKDEVEAGSRRGCRSRGNKSQLRVGIRDGCSSSSTCCPHRNS